MTDRMKNAIAAFELAIFAFIVWAAFKAGWITADTERHLYIGGGIGSIIGLGVLIARHRGVRLRQPDNLRLQVALLSQYFAGFLLVAYATGVSIALATGDFPANRSVIIAPFAFLAFALAAARAHVLLYRARIKFQQNPDPSDAELLQFALHDRQQLRIAKGLAIVQFLFLMEAGFICNLETHMEDAHKTAKTVTTQTEISLPERNLKAQSQPLQLLKHSLDLEILELKTF